jgi:diguanylate cyclase (GGDEF)-like protein
MKQKIVMFGLGWIAVVTLSLGWSCYNTRQHEEENILGVSRAFFQQVVLTREWNARHGGLYTFADASTPPNPYLKHPMRDIPLEDGRMLTMINPAYMTRQLSELASEHRGVQFHITSLHPIRPENAPLPWEREALQAFETGVKEQGAFFGGGYRYMAPLKTTESCLKCHEAQGYRLGDIRGGISITLPHVRCSSLLPLGAGHFLIAVVGLLLIGIFGKRLHEIYGALQKQTVMDPLTGIANRRYFMEKAAKEYRRAEREHHPLTLIMVDIDYFKPYNDTYGHLEGDRCLKRVAEVLKKVLKRPADCIARYGGEEFVVMLPDTPLSGGAEMAEQLRAAVEGLQIAHSASRCSDVVTASFGVAEGEAGEASCEALLRRADDALYRAKKMGRNRVETAATAPEQAV